MQIKNEFPPNIQEIKKKFPIRPGIVYAYGDTLYNPTGWAIPQDLMIHEEVHQGQQESCGVEDWWKMYIENPAFRLTQEVEAYRAQYKFLKSVLNRLGRRVALEKLSEQLSSDIYGRIISKKEAKELIDV